MASSSKPTPLDPIRALRLAPEAPVLYTPHPAAPLVNDWLDRHRDPRSFALHLVGIPATILGVLLIPVYATMLSAPTFVFALVAFVGGFAVQFLGHALDGTEPGEVKGLRTWWGRRRTHARPARVDPGSNVSGSVA